LRKRTTTTNCDEDADESDSDVNLSHTPLEDIYVYNELAPHENETGDVDVNAAPATM
jgi:hypothetical protein